ncbi:MAG: YqaA family protein [Holosporales bacterium]
MLKKSYQWILQYADHPRAYWVLMAIAFAESSIFPLPPDPLYIAMLVGNPERAWRLATGMTVASVVGGIVGYGIGWGLYESLGSWIIESYQLSERFAAMQEDFRTWGFWIVALKGLTPIPYKLVTIASGVAGLNLATFIIASIIARGFRFFLLAFLFKRYGLVVREQLEKNLGLWTASMLIALVLGFVIVKYMI